MVNRESLFALPQKLGCPPTLLYLIRSLHDAMEAKIYFEDSSSNSFAVYSGVKQGCVLASTVFDIFLILLHNPFGGDYNADGLYFHIRSDGRLFNLVRPRLNQGT